MVSVLLIAIGIEISLVGGIHTRSYGSFSVVSRTRAAARTIRTRPTPYGLIQVSKNRAWVRTPRQVSRALSSTADLIASSPASVTIRVAAGMSAWIGIRRVWATQ
jgi:hypothetical protein